MTSHPNTFSIVTIVYNDVLHILETMDSVISQTHKDIEYILIDGASTDGTKEAILNYLQTHTTITREENSSERLYMEATHSTHPTLTFKFLSQKDGGIYDAMNKGVALATREWINFMNCGDKFYDSQVLEKIAREDITEFDVVYGDMDIYYVEQDFHLTKKTSHDLDKLYTLFYHFGHPNCFIKTKLHQNNPFNLQYKLAADYDLIYRLYKQNCHFLFTNHIIATFTSGGASDSRGFESLKEALKVSLANNPKTPIRLIKIYGFYLFALSKKVIKLYMPTRILSPLLHLTFGKPK